MSADTYEILAVKYAERPDRKRFETFLMADDHAAPYPLDFFFWVIRNADRTIVVDTGFDEAENRRRGGLRRMHRTPAEALAMIGVAADAVDTVVITHLHFDHAGSLDAFDSARFHLQAAEMAYATGPCMCHAALKGPFSADHVCDMVQRVYSGRVVFHDGDAGIATGVTVHKLGGHSRGLQCVRVMTATGPVVLASDGTHFYENIETRQVFPIVVDVEDVLKGYTRMEELAGSRRRIVPGHDPLVLARYPALNRQTEGIVHRVDAARLDA